VTWPAWVAGRALLSLGLLVDVAIEACSVFKVISKSEIFITFFLIFSFCNGMPIRKKGYYDLIHKNKLAGAF